MKRSSTDGSVTRKIITLKNYQLVDGYVKDKAYVDETNDSAVVESILLEHILPNEPASTYYVREIYIKGLKETMIDILAYFDINRKPLEDCDRAFLLIRFLLQIFDNRRGVGYDDAYQYLLNTQFPTNCKLVAEKMKYEMSERSLDFDEKQALEDELLFLSLSQQNAIDFIPYNYLTLVVNNWEMLKGNKFVYRLISNVVALSMVEFWDYAEHRLKAIDVITEVCKTWTLY